MLREPRHANLTVPEVVKLADISKATYYNAFNDENFLLALESEMQAYRSQNDFAVMHNIVEQAKTTKNHQMVALFERLQGRLREGGDKPAQVIVVIGEGISRPKIESDATIINGETGEVEK